MPFSAVVLFISLPNDPPPRLDEALNAFRNLHQQDGSKPRARVDDEQIHQRIPRVAEQPRDVISEKILQPFLVENEEGRVKQVDKIGKTFAKLELYLVDQLQEEDDHDQKGNQCRNHKGQMNRHIHFAG